jgi:hydroxymethylglutaryl-CoA lyase
MEEKLHWVECPRDAMQGMKNFIPTEQKIAYLNSLLNVGFDTLDIGSFVSAKAIPQMQDSLEVIRQVKWTGTKPEFLVIVANERGAEVAVNEERVDVIGFPLSVSETFQMRNTGGSIQEGFQRLEKIQALAAHHQKKLVIYLSMGFGNPYEEPYSPELLVDFSHNIAQHFNPQCIAISDTIGVGDPIIISNAFNALNAQFTSLQFSAHLHTTPHTAQEKILAAWEAGCRRFDSAIGGWGGCPMAKDDLTGNMPSEAIYSTLNQHIAALFSLEAFHQSQLLAQQIFV